MFAFFAYIEPVALRPIVLRYHVITHERNVGGHHHIQRRSSQPAVQPNERLRRPRGKCKPQHGVSIEVDRRIRSAWCSFRNYTLEPYDRPSAVFELKIRMLKRRGPQDNAIRLRRVERRVESTGGPLRHAAPSSPKLPDSLHRLTKENRTDHPISSLDTLMKAGSESIRAIMYRRRILFAGFMTRTEDTRLPKSVMFGELMVGARAMWADLGKGSMGFRLDDL